MTFDECRFLIPQYLSGDLEESDRQAFEQQLVGNFALREEVEQLRPIWESLAALPQSNPGAALRARFYQRLNALERDRSSSPLRRFRFWPQLAFGVLLFLCGLFLGRINWGEQTRLGELAKMSAQVQTLRELVAVSMLERQSAASRLQGVAYSSGLDRPNEEVVSALFRALNHDSNVNVRLSSLDALEKYTKDSAVSKALVDSIEHQDSPLVQIALIDSLVSLRNRSAAGELKKLTAADDINPAVRERAQWGLQKLSVE